MLINIIKKNNKRKEDEEDELLKNKFNTRKKSINKFIGHWKTVTNKNVKQKK